MPATPERRPNREASPGRPPSPQPPGPAGETPPKRHQRRDRTDDNGSNREPTSRDAQDRPRGKPIRTRRGSGTAQYGVRGPGLLPGLEPAGGIAPRTGRRQVRSNGPHRECHGQRRARHGGGLQSEHGPATSGSRGEYCGSTHRHRARRWREPGQAQAWPSRPWGSQRESWRIRIHSRRDLLKTRRPRPVRLP